MEGYSAGVTMETVVMETRKKKARSLVHMYMYIYYVMSIMRNLAKAFT